MLLLLLLVSLISLILSQSNYINEKGYNLNTTSSYNPDLAVSFANSYCATNEEWLCAEVYDFLYDYIFISNNT